MTLFQRAVQTGLTPFTGAGGGGPGGPPLVQLWDAGSYSITASDASFALTRDLRLAPGSYALTGVASSGVRNAPTPCSIANVLDGLSLQPTGAYSTRKVKSTYAGNALRVWRRSDGHFLDIGFGTNCSLDQNALLTFCSGTDCTIATWYDQSGNGNDVVAYAGNYSQAPYIVIAGQLAVTLNTQIAIQCAPSPAGSNWLINGTSPSGVMFGASEGSLFAVGNATSGGTPATFSWQSVPCIAGADADFGGNGNMLGISFVQTAAPPITFAPSAVAWRFQGDAVFAHIDMNTTISYTFGTTAQFAFRYKTSETPHATKIYINGGIPNSDSNPAANNAPNVNFVIGGGGNIVRNLPFIGTIAEVFAFGTQLSVSDTNILGQNQRTYWATPWTNITL